MMTKNRLATKERPSAATRALPAEQVVTQEAL